MSAQERADTTLNDSFRWAMFHQAKRLAFFRYNSKFTYWKRLNIGNVNLNRYSKVQKSVFMYKRLYCKFSIIPQEGWFGYRTLKKPFYVVSALVLTLVCITTRRMGSFYHA